MSPFMFCTTSIHLRLQGYKEMDAGKHKIELFIWFLIVFDRNNATDKKLSKPCDAFGEVKFPEDGWNIAKFVRVDHQISMETTINLIKRLWYLSLPNLLISVIGERQDFQLDPFAREALGRGLVKAAQIIGAWIISDGLHTGVAKHIGKAIHDNEAAVTGKKKVVTIGIASWNCVQNKESLVNEEGSWPANYEIKDDIGLTTTSLDPNHSHFILVDDGAQETPGVEAEFRKTLEDTISQYEIPGTRFKVPAVVVLVGGKRETLKSMYDSISRNIPVVIVKGSGGAADVMASVYRKLHGFVKEEHTDLSIRCPVKIMDGTLPPLIKLCSIKGEVHQQTSFVIYFTISVAWMTLFIIRAPRLSSDLDHDDNSFMARQMKDEMDSSDEESDLEVDEFFEQLKRKDDKDSSEEDRSADDSWLENEPEIDQLFTKIFTNITSSGHSGYKYGYKNIVKYSREEESNTNSLQFQRTISCCIPNFPLKISILDDVQELVQEDIKLRNTLDEEPSKPCDAFGTVNFVGCEKTAKFLRVDHKTPMGMMMYLIAFLWNLALPNLLISMIGERKDFQLTPEIETFVRRFVKAAKTTGTWIISTGLHTGIEKHIGKTINDDVKNKIVTIGIAPWNCVQNKESLVNKGSWPAKYEIEIKDDIDSTTSALDPNHSHFILVDDGTQETSGVEMEFRKMFENTITDLNIPETGFKVPAVVVLVGGELETLKSVSDSISRNIPVVIVKGTGQAADVMAYAYERGFGKLKEFMDLGSLQKLKTDIREKITEEFEGLKINEVNNTGDCVLSSLRRPNLLTVYDINSDEDFGVAIFKAVFKTKNKCRNLKLTFKWERLDNALNKLFTEGTSWQINKLDDFMLSALKEGKTDIVKLFLECKINLNELLTERHINILYKLDSDMRPKETCIPPNICHKILVRDLMLTKRSLSIWSKFKNYIRSAWNIIDVITIVLFILGYILRLLDVAETARVIFCLNLISFYIRFLHMFSIDKNLGPKLIMIKEMMRDLGYFAMILFTFMIAFGIATQSILNPSTPASSDLFKEVFRKAYFLIYAELFLEEYEGNSNCKENNSTCPTEITTYSAIILMCIYVLLTNILLLNLLIAMFSSTYQKVQEKSHFHWSLQRYDIINEFYIRAPLPPPFIILTREYRSNYASKLLKWEQRMVQSYLSRQHKPDSNDKDLINRLTLKVEELHQQNNSQDKNIEEKFSKLCSRIDQLTSKEEELQQQLNNSQDENIEEKLSKLCSRINRLTLKVEELQHNNDEKMKNIDTSLAWIKENLMKTKP
ncbi:transient receptor potential cation channel subfamily M member-like 2 isoform X4 [Octopus vulgaris]|uniref:Transient receptor potential cation channel subfamily M member-like 2 isoform X4 n=1 Tax=Octopus vulgaris TaxID=6645 RepID=A0AA36BKY6_OCTVU|nr:transient receptor potential cation channel subfamily M member-like 2 isoform X4 [Octopus vulgaris]